MERGLVLSLFGIILSIFLITSASALFIGITDGYVKDGTGALVSGASVTATVSGCSGGGANGCVGSATSGVNGYYLVNNLNLPKLGSVSVTATKSGASGSASGTADNTQVAHVNVTMCSQPSNPSLTPVPDNDSADITFYWTSGTDPNLLTTTDDFRLDGNVANGVTSPRALTGLSFISHSWDVRTCNSGCCSDWVSDTFTLTCPSPGVPTQTPVADSHSTTASLAWTSGTDPHGRTIWDELDFDSVITNPAISPISKIGLSFSSHTWRVRTCNSLCCSSWVSDSFNVGNAAPSAPTNTNATPDNATSTTALSWDSGIDPEADPTYDEVQYQNGSVVNPTAVSPINVPTELLIKWRVRTCDSFGACSAWVNVDSVTCSASSATCPVCSSSGGGGGGRNTGGSVGTIVCNPAETKKVELYCNGIPFSNQTLLRINFGLGKNKQIDFYGVNWSLEDLDYCPWCYNGMKDYDEVGVDCGGTSCRPCTEAEIPQIITWNYLMWLSIITLVLLVIYILHKKGVFRKIFLRRKYYGI